MNRLHIDQVQARQSGRSRLKTRLWREWCFYRAALRHLWKRLLLMLAILLAGGIAFRAMEPEKQLSLPKATYYTFSLIFGEPPEEFPESVLLQVMFFLVPVLGLTVIIEGIVDLAVLVGDRRRFERSWCATMAASLTNHIILIGLGKLGYRTYRLLHRLGEPIVVIERDAQCQFLDTIRRDGTPLLIGDARRNALLEDANIRHAKSIVLAADDDLANLEIALDARGMKPDIRVVLRMFDQNMADKIRQGFDIHIAMSQSAISAPAFAVAAIETSIVGSFVVGEQLIVMQRWEVRDDGPFAGKTVGQVMAEFGVGVTQHSPAGGGPIRLFPPPETVIQPKDVLLLQAPYQTIQRLRSRVPVLSHAG